MDYVESHLNVIEQIIQEKDENECRKNVFETIGKLKKQYPQRAQEIEDSFKKMCKKYSKDFYKEIRNPQDSQENI